MTILPEPADGDMVVMYLSTAPRLRHVDEQSRCFAVIRWGDFSVASERLQRLGKFEAVFEARQRAEDLGRDAWDSTGRVFLRLPRLPLIYRSAGSTFAVSIDVTDYRAAPALLAWKSTSNLSEAEAIEILVGDGLAPSTARAALRRARLRSVSR